MHSSILMGPTSRKQVHERSDGNIWTKYKQSFKVVCAGFIPVVEGCEKKAQTTLNFKRSRTMMYNAIKVLKY